VLSAAEQALQDGGIRVRRAKAPAIAFLIAGFTLTVWLIFRSGAAEVGAALRTAGWTGLLAISTFHLMATGLMGMAWWRLRRRGRRWVFVWGRLVRDAGSEVLPLSQIGGSLLAARSIVLHGIETTTAVASVVVDVTIEFCAQIAFVALGVILLVRLAPDSPLTRPALVGLAVALVAAGVMIVLQRWKSDLFERAAQRVAFATMGAALAGASAVQAELREIYRSSRIWPSLLMHFSAWILSAVEAWLALSIMGAHFDFAVVLTLESLLYAMRGMAFLVPSAIGVQEGAYVILAAALGLPPGLALGLSLMKRGRDLLLGIPVLLSWQVAESRRR
jgi:putative membrane protein